MFVIVSLAGGEGGWCVPAGSVQGQEGEASFIDVWGCVDRACNFLFTADRDHDFDLSISVDAAWMSCWVREDWH